MKGNALTWIGIVLLLTGLALARHAHTLWLDEAPTASPETLAILAISFAIAGAITGFIGIIRAMWRH